MTLLPRMTTSPIVAPSRGTSRVVLVDDPHEVARSGTPWPWRARRRACSSAGSASQSGSHGETVIGPYVSVRP